MKKRIFFKSFLFLICSLCSLTFFSCQSTKQDAQNIQNKNTTFVNTKPNLKNQLFTVMRFSKITDVTAVHLKTNTKYSIPKNFYTYNYDTTFLAFTLPDNIPYKISDLIFTITGVPVFPAEFILTDGVFSKTKPGVFVNGKNAELGIDYTFSQNSTCIKFISQIDADKDSYFIIWLSKTGTNTMSNNVKKFENEYKLLQNEWFANIK